MLFLSLSLCRDGWNEKLGRILDKFAMIYCLALKMVILFKR